MRLRNLVFAAGIVAAGIVTPTFGGELEEPSSICCKDNDACKGKKNKDDEKIEACCFVGADCSTEEAGTQGYCMKSCT